MHAPRREWRTGLTQINALPGSVVEFGVVAESHPGMPARIMIVHDGAGEWRSGRSPVSLEQAAMLKQAGYDAKNADPMTALRTPWTPGTRDTGGCW